MCRERIPSAAAFSGSRVENVFQRGSRPDVFPCGASRAAPGLLMGHFIQAFRGGCMIASARVKAGE